MLNALLTVLKVKVWFATVNQYRGWQARRRLAAYVRTLSPEKQAWANDLRQRLDADPKGSVRILRAESSKLAEKLAHVASNTEVVRTQT